MAKATATLTEASSHNVPPDVFLKHYREIRDLKNVHSEAGMAVARAKKAAKDVSIDLDGTGSTERRGAGYLLLWREGCASALVADRRWTRCTFRVRHQNVRSTKHPRSVHATHSCVSRAGQI
jgi:hypothetical protein